MPQDGYAVGNFKNFIQFWTKANYQHTLKKDYELVKDYQRFEIKKISRKPDLKMDSILLEFENLIEFGHYRFSFGIPLSGENIQKIFVSRETSLTLPSKIGRASCRERV